MEETVKILRFDTADAVKSLADLRKYIQDAKGALEGMEIGSKEYNDQLRELQKAQDALRDSMNYGQKTVTAARGSYNDLVHTMRELKQEWRATSDEAERSALGDQIAAINSELKQLDASVGNYSRNVGDYRNAMMEVSVLLDGKTKKAIDGTGKALSLLSKNPVMGMVSLLLPLVMRLADSLKENESVTNAFSKALDSLKPVFDLVEKAVETLATWISKAVDHFAEMATESKGTFQSIVAGSVGVGNAILQYMLTPARTVIEAFKGLGNVVKDVFTGNFKSIKDDASTALKGIGDAVKKGFSFKGNFEEGKRIGEEFAAGLGSTKKKTEEAAKGTTKAAKDELEKLLDWQKDVLSRELSLLDAHSAARLAKEKELLAKQREIDVKAAKETIKDAETLAQTLTLIDAKYKKDLEALDRDFSAKTVEIDRQRMENRVNAMKEGTDEYLAAVVELRAFELDTLSKTDGESDAAFEARRIEAQKALQAALTEQTEQVLEEEHRARENRLLSLKEGSVEYLTEALALKQYELDTMHQLEGESNEAFRTRELEAEKAVMEAEKAIMDAKTKQWRGYAGVVSGLATSLADAYEGMAGKQEQAAERTKGIRIAAATIDTLSGAVAAYMSAIEAYPAPFNIVAGALQAATVMAAGIANINKIRSTSVKGGSSGNLSTAAAVSAPAVVQQVPVTRSLTSQTEEERLDRMASDQRVVLVYSDVEKADKYVKGVDVETSFGG